MSRDTEPVVASWYEDLETGRHFEVVDFDEDDAVVEIQYDDGDTDEIDLDEWYELDLEPVEPPEAWRAGAGDEDSAKTDYAGAEPKEEEEDLTRGPRRRVLEEEEDEDLGDWDAESPEGERWEDEE